MLRIWMAVLLLLCVVSAAPAAVVLSFSDGDATPNSVEVAPGGSFTVTLSLIADEGEQVESLDYFLQASAPGVLTLTDRDTTGSPFSDLVFTDAQVENDQLDPNSAFDLGASTSVSGSTVTGTVFVATFEMNVSPGAAIGSYTLATFSLPGTGWVSLDDEFSFDEHATFLIDVAPEPNVIVVVLVGLAMVSRRFGR